MKKIKQILSSLLFIIITAGVILWQLLLSTSVNYYIVCACVLVLSLLPFIFSFEHKNITAKEITLIATLIAIAVISRGVFYLIPQVKPIGAVVVVSAVCLGPQRGFIIGAYSAFISNFIFGQGYWTPFQMIALGLVGLVSGLIFKAVKYNKINLSIVGFILTFALYGIVVDISTVLIATGDKIFFATAMPIFISGIPFSFVFGLSTAIFLFLFGIPFINKINRTNTKFALTNN